MQPLDSPPKVKFQALHAREVARRWERLARRLRAVSRPRAPLGDEQRRGRARRVSFAQGRGEGSRVALDVATGGGAREPRGCVRHVPHAPYRPVQPLEPTPTRRRRERVKERHAE